jgi:hypothetical protein
MYMNSGKYTIKKMIYLTHKINFTVSPSHHDIRKWKKIQAKKWLIFNFTVRILFCVIPQVAAT